MNQEEQFWWNWWVQFGTGVATFLAVLTALFVEPIRGRLFPPKLTLKLLNPRGSWAEPTFIQREGQAPFETASRWYHVVVSNKRRWSIASDAVVCLVDYEIPNAAGEYVPMPVGAIPLSTRNVETRRSIGPPLEWNLLNVSRETEPRGRPLLQLLLSVTPTFHHYKN